MGSDSSIFSNVVVTITGVDLRSHKEAANRWCRGEWTSLGVSNFEPRTSSLDAHLGSIATASLQRLAPCSAAVVVCCSSGSTASQ